VRHWADETSLGSCTKAGLEHGQDFIEGANVQNPIPDELDDPNLRVMPGHGVSEGICQFGKASEIIHESTISSLQRRCSVLLKVSVRNMATKSSRTHEVFSKSLLHKGDFFNVHEAPGQYGDPSSFSFELPQFHSCFWILRPSLRLPRDLFGAIRP
jgi:hypothetical protein